MDVRLILVATWLAWSLYPLLDTTAPFSEHWGKAANFGTAFDRWFLNLFPRTEPFVSHPGGYGTLNFVPTLATMILGLIAGGWLKSDLDARARMRRFIISAFAGLALGLALDASGFCPLVKRIWTPSWVLFSGGWAFAFLAFFYGTIDWAGWKRWAFPLRVIGMNSITAYVMSWLLREPIAHQLKIHLGENAFAFLGLSYAPLLTGVAVLAVQWLILFWMSRQKLYIKI